ncbi:MAG TPA: SMP-30/gluconolactonase/LRE family protein [Chloroflexota bacterium]|nr:SMP-30/gluconolactonase/LRE family protein [Chloroflexota bacterium]
MQPERVADTKCALGEGPLWHADEQRLYWADITGGALWRWDARTGQHERCYSGPQVGGFTFQEDGSLLLFREKGSIVRWWDGSVVETLYEDIPEERQTRFNDVSADPAGRVFCGTMATKERRGTLYRLDTDGSLHVAIESVGISNGIGFTPDRRGMYYTDTADNAIYLFDYDAATGAISNRRVFASVPREEGEGFPDGMTVDAEGYVWSARWDGSCAVRYAPDGTIVERVAFPAKKVSSAAFGGPEWKDLYFTTAGGDKRETEGDGAGAIFRIRPQVGGSPEFRSRVSVKR